jgi:phage-related protein
MYHSLIFQRDGEVLSYNTWNNWHLIPSVRPVVAMPTPQYKYVEIPGSSDQLDLSTYLTGKIIYSDRKGAFQFYVDNDGRNWQSRRAELSEFFDGRKMKLILEDDPNYYYYGRFFFKEWSSDNSTNHSMVTIEYQLSAYRYRIFDGKEVGL